jgi:SAM-dependent methyltransferase
MTTMPARVRDDLAPTADLAVSPRATDWDAYYAQPYRFAAISRGIIARRLVDTIARLATPSPGGLRIGEVGGGNSSFIDAVTHRLRPVEYHIIDNNRLGLDLVRRRLPDPAHTHVLETDILSLPPAFAPALDCVFSIGLIEHFEPAETRRAIDAHFHLLRPGGLCVVSFPTPTLPYRAARRVSEAMGWWIFHDERPLQRAEVAAAIDRHGRIEGETTIWPIVFTQMLVAARRRGDRTAS